MQFHVIEPEVPGGLGKRTVIDHSVTPFRIERLHYQFDGWLGDDLVKSHPVFLCADSVATRLQASDLSGFEFSDVEVTRSSQFRELYPGRKLPPFRWLKVVGMAERDDFGLRDQQLVVSDRALSLLRQFSLDHARVRTVAEFPWDRDKQMDEVFEEARAFAEALKKQQGL